MKRKLFNELLRMAFEFFLTTHGAEVVCLAFRILLFFRQAQRRTQDLSINSPYIL